MFASLSKRITPYIASLQVVKGVGAVIATPNLNLNLHARSKLSKAR
jgi:hypothetical protein